MRIDEVSPALIGNANDVGEIAYLRRRVRELEAEVFALKQAATKRVGSSGDIVHKVETGHAIRC
jgi:hypothetical protein